MDVLDAPACDQLHALASALLAKSPTEEELRQTILATLAKNHHMHLMMRVHRFTSIQTGDAPPAAPRWDNAANTVRTFVALLRAVAHAYATPAVGRYALRNLIPVSCAGILRAGVGPLNMRRIRLRASTCELEVPNAMPVGVEGPEWAVDHLLR